MLYTSTIVDQAREYVDEVLDCHSADESAVTRPAKAVTIHPSKDLQFFPFFAVAQHLFGALSPHQKEQLADLAPLREELFRHVIRGGINRFAFAQYFTFLPGIRALNSFQAQWRKFVQEAYHAAATTTHSGGSVAPVVKLWSAVQEGKITEREV